MRDDHEEVLAHNPVLLARCFWHFAHQFEEAARGVAPTLPSFCVAAAMLYHAETVEKVHRMKFGSGLLKVIAERPDLLAGLQGRLEGAYLPSLRGLQVAVSTRLLLRNDAGGLPGFRAAESAELPAAVRDAGAHGEMLNASKRLGAWFGLEPASVIQRQLVVEF